VTMVDIGDGFYIAKQLRDKLFNYPKDGILFLWRLFSEKKQKQKKGCVLRDETGYV